MPDENRPDLQEMRTQRLVLRRPAQTDMDFVIDLFSRPELVAHRPDQTPDSPQRSAERLARDSDHWTRHGFGRWAVEANGDLIGFGGVTVSPQYRGLNLSYHFHPRNWGHGYATELVEETVRVAFAMLGADRIVGLARPANPASRRVLEKCGFVLEQEVMLHGAPTMLYALSRPASC